MTEAVRAWRLIGVPYTSMREPGGIDRAIGVLREAGAADALAALGAEDSGDLDLDAPSGERGPTELLNEDALARLISATREAVSAARADARVPLLLGGDCPVILGALAALGESPASAGLIMIDGHEDAWPPPSSPTGETSDSELGIALGLFGDRYPAPLGDMLPLLTPAAVGLIGPRDAEEIEGAGIESLRGSVAFFADDEETLAAGAFATIREALERVRADRFWLHIDLDALRFDQLRAVDYPQPGGLDWATLGSLAEGAIADPRFAGASVAIYNPRLDPDLSGARRIVKFLARIAAQGP